jgi:hypothetical protein
MGSVHPEIGADMRAWIERQRMFFVATAPSGDDGHVNLSPKGAIETFSVLGPLEVAYVDLYGSGIETVSHLKQNGRIVLLFCAFEGPPKLVRLHGRGHVVEQHDPEFAALRARFELRPEVAPTVRSVIRVEVTRVSDSCGFTVPLMSYAGERDQLFRSAASRVRQHGEGAIREYCDVNNGESIDGLDGLSRFGEGVSDDQRRALAHDGRKL